MSVSYVSGEYESYCLRPLNDFNIHDFLTLKEYDSFIKLASSITGKPFVNLNFTDTSSQFIKSSKGVGEGLYPLSDTFCRLTIQGTGVLVINDSLLDPRVSDLTCVKSKSKIRFYAGCPLINADGLVLGALSVTDQIPGRLSDQQTESLQLLANSIVSQIEERRKNIALNDLVKKFEDVKMMFNSSAELHCILDQEGKILMMNDVVDRMLGYSVKEVIGKTIWSLIDEEDLKAVSDLISKELAIGKTGFELEGRIKLKNGETRWMGWSVAIKNDKWFANGRDITDQKSMVAELEQLSLVASKVNNGVIISNHKSQVIWINAATEAITGYSFADFKGRKLGDVIKGKETDLQVIRNARELTKNKKSFSVDILAYKKNGDPVWLSVLNSVVLDDAGNIDKEVEVIIDISDRKKAEQELETLSLVASKTINGVAISNSDGMIKWVNQSLQDMTGYTLEDFRNTRPGDLLAGPGTDMELLRKARAQAAECVPSNVELLSYKKDGSPIWLSISNTPVFNQDGSLDQQVEIINDISERKLAEQELIKTREEALNLSKAKETFLSVMSHEIRTPLNAVIGMSHILLDDNPADSQIENLKILSFSAQNLLALINDILDYTKIETGNMVLENANVNLKELVSQTLNSLQFKTDEKAVVLKSEIDHRIPEFVIGDNTRLYQILINLLGNSVKFTEKGEVKLKLDLLEENKKSVKVRFEVSDTGIGIASDKKDYIFELYTQASSDTTRKYGGTGLGLAITKRLVELYDSEIHLESELGKGSVFSFTIEFKRSKHAVMQVESQTPVHELSGSILVVDDNEINRLLASKVLAKWGLKVSFAENGLIALGKVQQEHFDLILMDLHMPVMDGMEASKAIRLLGGHHTKVPIIALTASLFSHELETITECGMDGYVIKPFVPNELYSKIRTFLTANKSSQ